MLCLPCGGCGVLGVSVERPCLFSCVLGTRARLCGCVVWGCGVVVWELYSEREHLEMTGACRFVCVGVCCFVILLIVLLLMYLRFSVLSFVCDGWMIVLKVFKGARWMPWHQEPMKDVGICDKPGGVDNRTLRPGFPNGETRHHVMWCDPWLNV